MGYIRWLGIEIKDFYIKMYCKIHRKEIDAYNQSKQVKMMHEIELLKMHEEHVKCVKLGKEVLSDLVSKVTQEKEKADLYKEHYDSALDAYRKSIDALKSITSVYPASQNVLDRLPAVESLIPDLTILTSSQNEEKAAT